MYLSILSLLSNACLAPDPLRSPDAAGTRTGSVFTKAKKTSAPHELDPAILEKRSFHEAPMLAEKVRRGELPPVAERLPRNPRVIVPLEEIGQYGGRIRRALTGDIVQTPGVSKTLQPSLMGYERPLPKSIELMIAESYTFEDEGRTATFKLREGIKWSDGVPFTVDDILFFA